MMGRFKRCITRSRTHCSALNLYALDDTQLSPVVFSTTVYSSLNIQSADCMASLPG